VLIHLAAVFEYDQLKPNSITLSGRRQFRSWSQTFS